MLDPTLLSATWCIEVSRVQKNTLYSFFAHYLHSAEVILNTPNWSKHVWGLFVFFDNEKYFYRLNFSKSWNLKKKDISRLKKRARVVMKVCQCQFAGWGWGQARKQDVQGARLHPVNTWVFFHNLWMWTHGCLFHKPFLNVQLDIMLHRLHPVNTWRLFHKPCVDVQLDIMSASGHKHSMFNEAWFVDISYS